MGKVLATWVTEELMPHQPPLLLGEGSGAPAVWRV